MRIRKPLKSSAGFLRGFTRVGTHRGKSSILPAAQMTVGAVGAYTFAADVLGHEGPLFAATSAVIALGFSTAPRLRRVLEVAVGCTLGIAVGDLLLGVIGAGIWQAAVVLFVSIMLARFLDGGVIFTTQLGLQSLLVVLLPAPDGGPFTRSLDAIVGGCVALLITVLVPRDPRREPQHDIRGLLGELSRVLRESADAVSDSNSTGAWHALVRARNCQPRIDALRTSMRSSNEIARLAPVYRRHREELEDLNQALDFLDLAVRNSRVFARRLVSVINNAALSDEAIGALDGLLNDTADGVDSLGLALSQREPGSRETYARRARNQLAAVAGRLHPRMLGIHRLEGEAMILLFRPLVVDLLEATGLEHDESRDFMPEL